MVLLALALVCAVAYLLLRRRDRRMLRNGVLLLATLFFAVLGVVSLTADRFPVVQVLLVAAILLFPVGLVVLAGFLIANGVRMFRREGRSLGNTLSLIAGVALAGFVVVVFVLIRLQSTVSTAVVLLLVLVGGYVGAVYLVFLVYALVYGHVRTTPVADVVVVLGSGLVRGEVPPLLRSRLDTAIRVYQHSRRNGRETIMIPSGGQGADEPRPEGAAMAEYLAAQGVPSESIRPETRSRNTEENLLLSRAVQEEAGAGGTVLAVTSNYHVMRAAMLARAIGSDAQVIGSPTAAYYVPSAFLREFVAVVFAHRVLHAVALAAVVAFWVLIVTTQVL